jgi:hypothetical protein
MDMTRKKNNPDANLKTENFMFFENRSNNIQVISRERFNTQKTDWRMTSAFSIQPLPMKGLN